jgi:hypothetical protein
LFSPRYFSPYPLFDFEVDDLEAPPVTPQSHSARVGGVSRAGGRSRGRALDLLMGKLDRPRGAEKALLFVCEMCFKYMTDPSAYEAHTVRLAFVFLSRQVELLMSHIEILHSQTSAGEESLS